MDRSVGILLLFFFQALTASVMAADFASFCKSPRKMASNDHCYEWLFFLPGEEKSWKEGRTHCNSLAKSAGHLGRLAVLDTEAIWNEVKGLIVKAYTQTWLGARKFTDPPPPPDQQIFQKDWRWWGWNGACIKWDPKPELNVPAGNGGDCLAVRFDLGKPLLFKDEVCSKALSLFCEYLPADEELSKVPPKCSCSKADVWDVLSLCKFDRAGCEFAPPHEDKNAMAFDGDEVEVSCPGWKYPVTSWTGIRCIHGDWVEDSCSGQLCGLCIPPMG